jgi:hypothetical protein
VTAINLMRENSTPTRHTSPSTCFAWGIRLGDLAVSGNFNALPADQEQYRGWTAAWRLFGI